MLRVYDVLDGTGTGAIKTLSDTIHKNRRDAPGKQDLREQLAHQARARDDGPTAFRRFRHTHTTGRDQGQAQHRRFGPIQFIRQSGNKQIALGMTAVRRVAEHEVSGFQRATVGARFDDTTDGPVADLRREAALEVVRLEEDLLEEVTRDVKDNNLPGGVTYF